MVTMAHNASQKPGYKQTEVGVIPEDWDVQTYLDVCIKIQDGTHFSPKLGGNDYQYITSRNVRFGFLDISNADWIDAAQHKSIYKRCDVKYGDLLLTKDGANTGNAALNNLNREFSLLSSVAFLRFDSKRYVACYFLQQILSTFGQQQIKEAMSGNAITRLTLEKIKKLRFPVPAFPEQTAIATALSDVDALIASLDKLIAKKRAIKQATMQQLLTGKLRLPGFSGKRKPVYKQTEIGMIPEDWEPTPLGLLSAFITKGATPTTYGFGWVNDGVLFLRSECVSEQGLDLTQSMFITPEAHNVLKRGEVRAGDILITITGNVGRVIYLSNDFGIANINQHIARIRIIDSNVAADYIFHFLSLPTIRKYYSSITTGQAYPQISLKQVRDLKVPLPPTKSEQTAIATVLSDMDAEIVALERRRDKTRALKQGMMQELLTGKTRLV